MAAATRTEYELNPVKFSRLAKRGLLLGLSGPQLVCLGVAAFAIVIALYLGGGMALAYASPFWLCGACLSLVGVNGRKLIEWAPITLRWATRAQKGQTMFNRRLNKPRPAGTLALPGSAAALRQWVDPTTGAVMVHDPHAATLTAVIEVAHPSFVLLDPAEQERRVQAWSRVLATTCRSGRIARLQVLERTLPDSGSGLADWWRLHGKDDGSWTAKVYQELIRRAGPASERHATTISVALDMKAASHAIRGAGGGMKGAAAVLAQEMNTLTTALRSADLNPGRWLGPDQLAFMLRTAYDPAAAITLERHPQLGHDLADAGPVAVRETWNAMRTDTACHAVLWISEWPRAQVFPGFLSPVLLSSGIRRTFSLMVMPMRADQAARDIRRKKTEHIADQAQRAKIGQIEDAATTAEYVDVLKQEADLTNGHGVVRYVGLMSVSAKTEDGLQAALAAIEQAAVQASCETRTLVGQQAQAFTAAALPLCREV
ncbi:MAG: type VII secretion protein EccE [Promicromonosporaceae bacterium]|nr:type VII secretion protein EccE [Promicromonosporaceae bacterium]